MSGLDEVTLQSFEFIERCAIVTQPQDLVSSFTALIAAFGIDHFVVARLPAVNAPIDSAIVLSSCPPGWEQRYRERGYHQVDPVMRYCALASQPFTWTEALARCPPDAAGLAMMAEAAGFGLVDGFVTPMVDPDSFQAVVALAAGRPLELAARARGALALASIYFKSTLGALAGDDRPSRVTLSPREVEVLSWIAVGKSQWEISAILNISERTVESHLCSIRRKLDVANTVQAVAQAIKQRLIVP